MCPENKKKNSEIDHELRESNSAIKKNYFFDFLDDYKYPPKKVVKYKDFESARNYVHSLEFKSKSDLIVANRDSEELGSESSKLFTRDIYKEN